MPKRPSTKTPSNVAKRSRVAVTLDVKLDIVKRDEHGEGTSVIGRVHGLVPSTVHSIVKSADKIKEMAGSATPLTATKVMRFRDAEMESMERMLSTWIDDQTQRLKTPLSQHMIQHKAVENNNFQCKLTAIMSEVADNPGSDDESEVADDPGSEESEVANDPGSEESEVANDPGSEESEVADDPSLLSPQ
ncbi:CENPB DNA-binding domain containing protein 1-like 2 [Homarus americanus]|uniref:CENPB DNA-binding domain containing protein 1-like 2 n=1 Tax=Homarus americanus TaxID=6706 RepID=A0A8J5JVQ4_HOMAM|nr:CENPB DNA-binding domain containing protein 1-like 2 [Homarus americanus]